MVKELLNGNPVRCILEIGKMIFLVDKGYSKPNVRKVKLNMMVNLLATLRKWVRILNKVYILLNLKNIVISKDKLMVNLRIINTMGDGKIRENMVKEKCCQKIMFYIKESGKMIKRRENLQ